ncbi:MAG: DNA polymerase III subunit delta [Lachnospiraceae bacterium]|nr:DNA polymerase III subunit delta [Lachnospiraceae bacterium]
MKSIDQDIQNGTFKRFYLLYGEERYLRNQYRDKLIRAIGAGEMNEAFYQGKDVNIREVIDLAETMPFLAEHRLILLEDTNLAKTGGDELAGYIPSIPETTVIILSEAEVGDKSKVFKAAQKAGGAVEFKRLDEQTLTTWILSRCKKEGKQIETAALRRLYELCDKDMVCLSSELEKLFCYTYERDSILAADVEAICAKQTDAKIYDMLDAIAWGNLQTALEIYYEMLSAKEDPMRILAKIARQFNQILVVKKMREAKLGFKEIAQKTNIFEFAVKKHDKQARVFTEELLRSAIAECVELEEAVKTGKLIDSMSVEFVIIRYAGRKREAG